MNLNVTIKDISNQYNLNQKDVLRIAYKTIEQAIAMFKEEINLAKNVETLEFLRRTIWDQLFSVNGCYYDLCKRSPMLKIMRLNADIRYCQVLKQKTRSEEEEITYQVIKSSSYRVQTRRQVLYAIERKQLIEEREEVDGELVENEYNI